MKTKYSATFMAIVVLALGCTTVNPPGGYASTDRTGRYDYKAISTNGHIFTMRAIDNDDKQNGTLTYWTDSTKNQLTLSKGYELKEQGDFRCGKGPGKWLLFGYKYKGQDYLYITGLVVDGDTIYVMEAAGPTDKFEAELANVRKAFESLK